MNKLLDILNKSVEYLKKKCIKDARLKVESIFSEVLKMPRIMLYANFEKELSQFEINKIKEKYIGLEEATEKVDFFAITVGIIMHDISKSSIKRNEENLSHSQMMIKNPEYIISAVYEVLNFIEGQVGYTLIKEVRENIAHIVQSHHGKWGKVQPETEEANIVYLADMESAKYHRINPIQANDILKYSVKGLGLTEIEKKLNLKSKVTYYTVVQNKGDFTLNKKE